MQETDTKPTTPTRRAALGFTAAAITAGLSAPVLGSANSRHPADAELIALCAAFHRQNDVANTSEGDADLDAAMDIRNDISDKIEDITAATDAGRKAKAEVAIFLLEENHGPDVGEDSAEIRFAYAVLLDMAGRTVA